MALMSFKIDPINRDIALFLGELSPAQRSKQFAELARVHIDDAKQTNTKVLGREPPSTTYVDGQAGAALESVRNVIFTEFELIGETLVWIADQLEQNSPVKTGRYKWSHIVLADGVEVDPSTQIKMADEFVFINTQPYARKIERGLSSQAPDGVYQAVAVMARRRFGNVARITFSYRTVIGGTIIGGRAGDRSSQRNPAIIVRIG